MRRSVHWTILLIITLLAGGLLPLGVSASPEPRKVAVLISTGRTQADNTWYHSEYWYDLALTYRMLIDNGFTHDDIYVLYGDGTDFASTHTAYQNPYSNPITDYACNRTNIQNIFNWLNGGNAAEGIPALTTNDFLFVWWMGHGEGGAACDTTFSVSTTNESVTDAELAQWTRLIPYRRRAFVFMTCHSGGAIDNLQNATTVTLPSCTCTQGAYSGNYDVVHGEWTYWVDGALRKLLPTGTAVSSDTDADNLVSLQETFNWGSTQPMSSTAQLSDPRIIAPCVFIRLAEPGKDIEIFSKDHVNDDGTVPSNYETWYHGPDLWVRHRQDGGTTHQNPEYGETNYIYANVHNIGCVAVRDVTVDFSWVEPSGWSNPNKWDHIGTATIPYLFRFLPSTVNVPWRTVPLPGFYCLRARLNVTDDPENADGRVYMDNNKVQINVTVEDTLAGAGWGWFFFIENGGEEPVPIDLVFDTVATPPDTLILLESPPGLEFEEVQGADIFEMEDGWSLLPIPAAAPEPIRVVGVQLEPGERRLAILTVTLPEGTEMGEEATIIFEEQVYGEVMGGIRFVSRAAEPQTVICELVREKINVFYDLEFDGATDVAEICSDMMRFGECPSEEAFIDSIVNIAEFEYVVVEELQGILPPRYGRRYVRAREKLLEAVEEQDLLAIVEAQQEVLLYVSIFLADAFTH